MTFGKPILIMRDTTERPEGVQTGAARLVGHDENLIFAAVHTLLEDQSAYASMANKPNPYGDGRAAERIVAVLERAVAGTIGPGPRGIPISDCRSSQATAAHPPSAVVNPQPR